MENFKTYINEKFISNEIKTKWKPRAGIFTEDSQEIAEYLKKNSDSLEQAMSRLNFYVNRAGDNLSASDKERLESAKEKLHKLFEEESLLPITRTEDVLIKRQDYEQIMSDLTKVIGYLQKMKPEKSDPEYSDRYNRFARAYKKMSKLDR